MTWNSQKKKIFVQLTKKWKLNVFFCLLREWNTWQSFGKEGIVDAETAGREHPRL